MGRPGRVGPSQKDPPLKEAAAGQGKANVNSDDLPDEIVQPLFELGRRLLEHVRAHRDHSLAEHEDGVLAAWRIVAPVLLEGVLRSHDRTGEHCAADRSAMSRLPGATRRAVAAQARGTDAAWTDWDQAVVAPLLALRPWLEPT